MPDGGLSCLLIILPLYPLSQKNETQLAEQKALTKQKREEWRQYRRQKRLAIALAPPVVIVSAVQNQHYIAVPVVLIIKYCIIDKKCATNFYHVFIADWKTAEATEPTSKSCKESGTG